MFTLLCLTSYTKTKAAETLLSHSSPESLSSLSYQFLLLDTPRRHCVVIVVVVVAVVVVVVVVRFV